MKYPIKDKNIIIENLSKILNDYNSKKTLNKRIVIQSILRDYIYNKWLKKEEKWIIINGVIF